MLEGADAVLVERGRLVADRRHVVILLLIRAEDGRLQVRDTLVEQGGIAGHGDVVVRDQRQEEQVVGDAGADPGAARRVPPVLDIPFLELPGGRSEDLGPGFLRGPIDQGHDVLKLVAEPVRPAGLIERRPRPDPAGQDLIQQPAVDQHVDRRVGRPHLDGVQDAVPPRAEGRQRPGGLAGCGVRSDDSPDFVEPVRLTECEDDFLRLAGRQGDFRRDRGARIERRTDATGQAGPAQCGRCGGRAVTAQELGTVRGERVRPRPHAQEGEPTRKGPTPGRAREDCAGLRVVFTHDLKGRVVPDRSQHPLGIVRRRQPSGPVARVPHGQAREFDRIVRRDQEQQFLLQPVALADVPGVALAMADGDGRPGPAGAAESGSSTRRWPRRAGKPPRRAGRRPGRWTRASGGSSGCCRPRCSRARPPSRGSRRPGLARTLIHGAGGSRGPPGAAPSMTMTYSRPSRVKPPRPFQKTRSPGGVSACGRAAGAWRVVCRQFRRHGGRSRLVPELLGQRTAIAPEDRPSRGLDQIRPSSGTVPAGRTNTPPGLPSKEPAGPLCRSLLSRSTASRGRSSRMTRSRSMPRRRT